MAKDELGRKVRDWGDSVRELYPQEQIHDHFVVRVLHVGIMMITFEAG
ncbi:MAG: hypothetical protein HQK57_08190 [Deltaproteobacteria bacterium]|nr:hypothetical protein [Deltaproteobacteria bacterium]MBF0525416.1 hypothetical protein [Deltaproteobacteria bacterium]